MYSDESLFQFVVVLISVSGFLLALCLMEIGFCIYSELRGKDSGLPTQKSVRRVFQRLRRFFKRPRRKR